MKLLLVVYAIVLSSVLLSALSEAYPSLSDDEPLLERNDFENLDMDALTALLSGHPKTKRGFCPYRFTFSPVMNRCIPSLRALRGRSGRSGRSVGPN